MYEQGPSCMIREYTLYCRNLSSSCRKAQEQQFYESVLQLPQGPRATVFGNAATGDGAMPAQHYWDISCRRNCPDTPTAGTCLSVLKHIPLTHIASLDMVVSKGHAPLLMLKEKLNAPWNLGGPTHTIPQSGR